MVADLVHTNAVRCACEQEEQLVFASPRGYSLLGFQRLNTRNIAMYDGDEVRVTYHRSSPNRSCS